MNHNKEHYKPIFKFNGGRGAILCSNCYTIIYEGSQITNDKLKIPGPMFCCEECRKKWDEKKNKQKIS